MAATPALWLVLQGMQEYLVADKDAGLRTSAGSS